MVYRIFLQLANGAKRLIICNENIILFLLWADSKLI